MKLPKQSPPVQRPHFVQPHMCIDATHGRPEDLLGIRMDLLHGANYNDPAPFIYRQGMQYSSLGYRSCGLAAMGIL